MRTQPAQPLLVPTVTVAQLLSINPKTVMRLVADGALQAVYIGPRSHPRFRRADVERLAQEGWRQEGGP